MVVAPSEQKTQAFHRLQDDVPAEVKQRRLEECISVFREEAARVNSALVDSTQLVLVEGVSPFLVNTALVDMSMKCCLTVNLLVCYL